MRRCRRESVRVYVGVYLLASSSVCVGSRLSRQDFADSIDHSNASHYSPALTVGLYRARIVRL